MASGTPQTAPENLLTSVSIPTVSQKTTLLSLNILSQRSSSVPTPPINPNGWCIEEFQDIIKDSQYCYQIRGSSTTDRYDWSDANFVCHENKASLLSLHSEEETDTILKHADQSQENFWIGLEIDGKMDI